VHLLYFLEVVEILEKRIFNRLLGPAHCHSTGPPPKLAKAHPARVTLHAQCQGDHAVRALCCRWTITAPARFDRCPPLPPWPRAPPCVLIPSEHGFIKMNKPFASSLPCLCLLLHVRTTPRCRASPLTGATPLHLKPLGQPLVCQGALPSWSHHQAAILREKASMHRVAAASIEDVTP
jgi:hypothetical protein